MAADRSDLQHSKTLADWDPQAGGEEPFFLEVDPNDSPESATDDFESVGVSSGVVASDEDAAAESTPGWFKPGSKSRQPKPAQERPARRSKSSKPKIAVEPEDKDEPPLPWQKQVKQWILGFGGVGYAISLTVHAILLLILSIVLIKNLVNNDDVITVANDSDNDPVLFEAIETEIDIGGDEVDTNPLVMKPLEIPQQTLQPELNFEQGVTGAETGGGNDGQVKGPGSGFKFRMPKSGKAVTKGSFTAWTNPEDPLPGQDYLIIIQIKLPPNVRRYPKADLRGLVVGTDGYRQPIPSGVVRGYLPVKEGATQLVVPVPGAARLVKDTIEIRSVKILKEKQNLEIEF